jgi:hydroxymethylglutaryl-CoA lyase
VLKRFFLTLTSDKIKVVECPRDAMQGIHTLISTDAKVEYINQLLKVGYHTIDFGSFVSPKAIPQMADTAEVISRLDTSHTATKLLAIVANIRGAEAAASYESVDYIGFPFSISETFQIRNTNTTIAQAFEVVSDIAGLCAKKSKKLVLYISMGFGNPYGDIWNADICLNWIEKMRSLDIDIFSLSDTVGIATPESISYLFKNLIVNYPNIEFGAHLHTQPYNWEEKIHAAYTYGCRRFDTAIQGYGGCPMAKDDLTGNMPTENLISYCMNYHIDNGIDIHQFISSMALANKVFPK